MIFSFPAKKKKKPFAPQEPFSQRGPCGWSQLPPKRPISHPAPVVIPRLSVNSSYRVSWQYTS